MTHHPLTKAEREELRRLHESAADATWSRRKFADLPIADCQLAAAARNALPRLLADLDAAEAQRDRAESELDAERRMRVEAEAASDRLMAERDAASTAISHAFFGSAVIGTTLAERVDYLIGFSKEVEASRCGMVDELASTRKERDALKGAAHTAFVMGADWARYQITQCTSFASERDEASAEAEKRFPYVPRIYEVMNKELTTERDALKAKLDYETEASRAHMANSLEWKLQRDEAKAKLAALVEAADDVGGALRDIAADAHSVYLNNLDAAIAAARGGAS